MSRVIIEYVTWLICALVKVGECCDYVHWCICTLWIFVGIFELGSNCMSYLLVLIHLMNIFDDNHFDNSNEVRIVYVYTYDVMISLIMMIACL